MSDLTPDIAKGLAEPFDKSHIKWVIVARNGKAPTHTKELWAPYIDRNEVQDRLDQAAGAGNWSFDIEPILGSPDVLMGRLTVLGITKGDVGDGKGADSPLKAAASDALKRCAVHFGIGRHLGFENQWLDKDKGPPRQGQPVQTSRSAPTSEAPKSETPQATEPVATERASATNGGDSWAAKLGALQKERGWSIDQIVEMLDIAERHLESDHAVVFRSYVGQLRVQHDWDPEQAYRHVYERLTAPKLPAKQPAKPVAKA